MNIAVVPVKTPTNHNYFLKDVSREENGLTFYPLKCDAKLRLKDILGSVAEKKEFVLQKIRVHRIYFKVDQILIEYPSALLKTEHTPILIDHTILDEAAGEKLVMVTVPDSRTGEDVARMVRLTYDKDTRTVMLLSENDYKDWIPVGFEGSFAG